MKVTRSIVALVLILTLIFSSGSIGAFAETGEVSPYIVTQTDLENATGTTSDGTTSWGIYDSGEADHGKVYVIKRDNWSAISNGNTGVKYTYNSNEYTLFDEPIETNTYYIFSYDHKSFPIVNDDPDVTNSTLNDGGRFTIAPPVSIFANEKGTDWRNIPLASDNAWSRHTMIFNSESQTAFNGKINTLGTYTTSYVDNVKLVKAAKLDVYNPGGSELSLDGTGLMTSEKLGGYFAEMGQPLTIKAAGNVDYESIVEVTHGGEAVEEVNGVYTIPAVTGEVKVKFGLNIDDIEDNAGVVLKNGTVYTDCGKTYAKFLSKFGMPKNVIEFYNADGEKQSDLLKSMVPNLTAKVVYDGEKLRDYNIKYLGDVHSDGELKVSDIITLIDGIVNDTVEDTVQADVNGSKHVTVSDVVKLRRMIMEQGPKEVNQFKVLAIGNSFSINATTHLNVVAKAAGFADEDLMIGNVWYSGCSLEQHMRYTKNGENMHNFYYWDQGASQSAIKETNLKTAIQHTDWDYIIIQQVSHLAGKYDSYQPYGDELIDYIKENATNPDVKIGWHMTWAYPQTPPEGYSSHKNFVDYGSDQITMYNAIVDASTNFASVDERIELVIPSGTAVQNLREKVGDVVTRDQFHMNETYGCIMLALTWIKTITGKDIEGVKDSEEIMSIINAGVGELADRGVTVTADQLMEYVIQSANDAVANPSTITK